MGTEQDPGPVTMTSGGTNRGCGPVVRRGQSRARECRAKASSGSGLLCAQGRGGPGLGSAGLGLRSHRSVAGSGYRGSGAQG